MYNQYVHRNILSLEQYIFKYSYKTVENFNKNVYRGK